MALAHGQVQHVHGSQSQEQSNPGVQINGQREPLEQQHMIHHAHTQKLTQSNFYQQQSTTAS